MGTEESEIAVNTGAGERGRLSENAKIGNQPVSESRRNTEFSKSFAVIICLLMIVSSIQPLHNCMSIMTCEDLAEGRMQKMEEAYTSIDRLLETEAGNDVVITITKPEDTVIFEPLYGEDPEQNKWFVQYYKLKSLVVHWQ